MIDMPHKNIDVLRHELMIARLRKTTFTSVEVILISYALFWFMVFALSDQYTIIACYTILGSILTQQLMLISLGIISTTMIIAGFTKIKWLRCTALIMTTAFWLLISSSIFLESLNTRSASIILAIFSAYQFIEVIRGRCSI